VTGVQTCALPICEHGVLIGSEGPAGNVLKLRPPMCFGPEHVERAMMALEGVAAMTGEGS